MRFDPASHILMTQDGTRMKSYQQRPLFAGLMNDEFQATPETQGMYWKNRLPR
jgi:hypothetical protein